MISAVVSPRRARTVSAVSARRISSPAPFSRRARNQAERQTLSQSASSITSSVVRGPRPFALRASSWWTKSSLRVGNRRTQPRLKKPRGSDRIVVTSHEKSRSARAACRRSAKRPQGPGRTSPGPARGSCSRRARCAARSRVVHGCSRVGASGPRWFNVSQSCARSMVSTCTSAIRQKCISRPHEVRRHSLRPTSPLCEPAATGPAGGLWRRAPVDDGSVRANGR